jgi:hypothetical protein
MGHSLADEQISLADVEGRYRCAGWRSALAGQMDELERRARSRVELPLTEGSSGG